MSINATNKVKAAKLDSAGRDPVGFGLWERGQMLIVGLLVRVKNTYVNTQVLVGKRLYRQSNIHLWSI